MVVTAFDIIDLKPSPRLRDTMQKVLKTIEPLVEDRYFGPEIEKAAKLVLSNLQMI